METPTLRERQRRETHEAIRDAALTLAAERGVASITVADVAQRAGVSQRTFFNHYRTKEEALVPQMVPFRPEAVAAFLKRREPDLLDALEALLWSNLEDMQTASGSATPQRVMRLVQANQELLAHILGAFEELQSSLAELVARRTGRSEPDAFCHMAALVTTGATRVALLTHLQTSGEGDQPIDRQGIASAFDTLRALLDGTGSSTSQRRKTR